MGNVRFRKVFAGFAADSQDVPPFMDEHGELEARCVGTVAVQFKFLKHGADAVFYR